MKKIIFILATAILPTSLHSQLALYNDGGDALTFYIGQDDIVQAEGDVTNGASATMEFENAGEPTLALKGNFVNSTSGIYTLGSEYIEFNGSSLQTLDFGGDPVHGVRLNNASGIQVDRSGDVTGDIDFTLGDLISTSSSYLTLGVDATVSNVKDDSHAFGPIAKSFNSTSKFTFPTGSGTVYRASSFTPETATAVTMRSMYYRARYPQWRFNPPLGKKSEVEYWDMYRISGSTDGNVGLTWDANSDVGTTENAYLRLRVAYLNGWWSDAGQSSVTGSNAAGEVLSSNSWSNYNTFFTLATDDISINPLPVELLSFKPIKNQNNVDVTWATASEINADYFSVYHSTNGIDFEEIAQIPAAGNSTNVINYSFVHENPSNGFNYYRIRNVDFDGSSETFDIKSVQFNNEHAEVLNANVYPNPVASQLNIDFTAVTEGKYTLRIFEITGQLVYTSGIMAPEGYNSTTINVDVFVPGKYIIQIITPEQQVITKTFKKL